MKYLLVGKNGQLGKQFEKIFIEKRVDYIGVDVEEMDITKFESVKKIFDDHKPNILINCSAYNNVEGAEKDDTDAVLVNKTGVSNLVKECIENNCFLIHYSTNFIFDGLKETAYKEEDKPNPLGKYGNSKLLGEIEIKSKMRDAFLILRTSWLYGEGRQNFIYKFLQRYSQGQELLGVTDEISTPTSTRLLVDLTMKSLDKKLEGIYHAVNSGFASRWEWANEILNIIGDKKEIKKVEIDYFNLLAKLPKRAVLDNGKISKDLGIKIPEWKGELRDFIQNQNYLDLNF